MSGLKNMSRGGYIVVGIVMALILVPSGVAAALAYTGIEGSSGHVANVSDAGQLLTTEANPSSFFQNSDAVLSTSKLIRIATPSPTRMRSSLRRFTSRSARTPPRVISIT